MRRLKKTRNIPPKIIIYGVFLIIASPPGEAKNHISRELLVFNLCPPWRVSNTNLIYSIQKLLFA
jgi:hypothetical protein